MVDKAKKIKLADRKLREKKVKALRELSKELESEDYDSKRSDKVKRTYRYGNKRDREQGRIAEDMIDIAGVIEETGDPYLGKLGMLRTKYKTKEDAKKAGVEFKAKGGEVKGYMGGGSVHKNKKNMITTKGWGASRKT
jgi:hypothetical protein